MLFTGTTQTSKLQRSHHPLVVESLLARDRVQRDVLASTEPPPGGGGGRSRARSSRGRCSTGFNGATARWWWRAPPSARAWRFWSRSFNGATTRWWWRARLDPDGGRRRVRVASTEPPPVGGGEWLDRV